MPDSDGAKRPSVPLTVVWVPREGWEPTATKAREEARRVGVADAEWDAWRDRHDIGADLAMIADPGREAECIRAAVASGEIVVKEKETEEC